MQNTTTQQNPIAGQIPTGGQSSFNTQILTRGQPPSTGQIPVSTQPMAGGQFQPFLTRKPPQSWGPPQGGLFHQPHQGGPSTPNPQGGILNPNPSGQPFPGVLNLT